MTQQETKTYLEKELRSRLLEKQHGNRMKFNHGRKRKATSIRIKAIIAGYSE